MPGFDPGDKSMLAGGGVGAWVGASVVGPFTGWVQSQVEGTVDFFPVKLTWGVCDLHKESPKCQKLKRKSVKLLDCLYENVLYQSHYNTCWYFKKYKLVRLCLIMLLWSTMGLLGRVHTHALFFDGKCSDCATVYWLTDVMTQQITIILELIKPLVMILSPVLIVSLCGVCKKSFPQLSLKWVKNASLIRSNEPCLATFRVSD